MNWDHFFKSELDDIQPYQPGLREEQIKEIAETPTIHKLSSNESPYPPFPAALEAMKDSLAGLNEYCDGGCYDLKQGLSAHLGVPTKEIMVGNGTNELLMLLAEASLQAGDRVAFCWPSFIVYRMGAEVAGVAFDEVPLKDDGSFDVKALLAAITPQTKLVMLCSPNNPTGGIISQDDFAFFMQEVPSHVLVVLDLAYSEFVTSEDHLDPMSYYDGKRPLVVLYTFSKIYGLAGARVGYGIAPEPVITTIDKLREPFNVNSVAQAGALASLGSQDELAWRRADNAAERARLCEALDRLGIKYFQSHANFVWAFVPEPEETFNKLLKQGVIVRPFPGGGGLRIGVGKSSDTDATIKALEKIFG